MCAHLPGAYIDGCGSIDIHFRLEQARNLGTVPIFVSAKMGLSPLPGFGVATTPFPQISAQPHGLQCLLPPPKRAGFSRNAKSVLPRFPLVK